MIFLSSIPSRKPLLIAFTLTLMSLTASAQNYTMEFARIINGGGLSTSANYQVESAINTEPGGPGFHQMGMYDNVPVLWLENPSLQPYIDLVTPANGFAFNGATTISVNWKTTPQRAGTVVQLELWRQNTLQLILGIDSNLAAQGTFNAFVPFVPTASDYTLRLRSFSDGTMWDDSNPISITSSGPNAIRSSEWTLYQ